MGEGSALQYEGKNKYPPSPRSKEREEKADEDWEISIHVRTSGRILCKTCTLCTTTFILGKCLNRFHD